MYLLRPFAVSDGNIRRALIDRAKALSVSERIATLTKKGTPAMMIRTQCKKCGVILKLDFGNMTKEEALAMAEKMDTTPRECPGMHVELGGWKNLYDLDDAIHRAYDLGEGEVLEPVMTDQAYVEKLLAEGKDVIDGGQNTVPELHLPRLHEFPDLDHIGFGYFKNTTHLFVRCDSPRGTRFYTREPKASSQAACIPA